MPATLVEDKIIYAASELKHAIKNISPTLFHKVGDTQMEASYKLENFSRI